MWQNKTHCSFYGKLLQTIDFSPKPTPDATFSTPNRYYPPVKHLIRTPLRSIAREVVCTGSWRYSLVPIELLKSHVELTLDFCKLTSSFAYYLKFLSNLAEELWR